mgnify:CR=1 FL=1
MIFAEAMKKNLETETGRTAAGLHTYRLVIDPDEEVGAFVRAEQRRMALRLDRPEGDFVSPVMTVASFVAWENMEEALVHRLQLVARRFSSFDVWLNNFGGHPSREIFLRVQDREPFLRLAIYLESLAPYIKPDSRTAIGCIPRLPVLEGLTGEEYEQVIGEYAGREYTARFMVSRFRLLRSEATAIRETGVFRLLPFTMDTN